MANSTQCENKQVQAPRIVAETMIFSGGQKLELAENDTVVFVGPNNAGKSACLREIASFLGPATDQNVVNSIQFRKIGTNSDFRDFLDQNAVVTGGANPQYSGFGYSFATSHSNFFEQKGSNFRFIVGFFVSQLETKSRIGGADASGQIRLFQDPPNHPIHLLMQDSDLENEMSELFKRAYDKELFVFRAGGSEFPLFVGSKPKLAPGVDALSRQFVTEAIEHAQPLSKQGDGMRSFCNVMLRTLLSTHHSMQILDEPEAFIHPPQARLLGEYLSQKRKSHSQLFVATHSAAILEGLCASPNHDVRIVRITRKEDENFIHEIEPLLARKITTDPTARFSRVLEGLFYRNVIITEADADSLFYNATLGVDEVSESRNLDVLFLHGAGKSRIADMAELLISANVNTSTIVDIDIIRDTAVFKKMFEIFGGDWQEISSEVASMQKHVSQKKPPLSVSQVRRLIDSHFEGLDETSAFTNQNKSSVQTILKQTSSWEFIKTAGRSAFSGAIAQDFAKVCLKASEVGIWIVPVGEIEGFCRTASLRHGPAFVQDVLEARDLATDPELREAREFMKTIAKTLD